jgi:hypothetical protein
LAPTTRGVRIEQFGNATGRSDAGPPWTRSCPQPPGRGDLALARLRRAGKVPAVLTRTIDNLHQARELDDPAVIALHGNTTQAACLEYARRYRRGLVRSGSPPPAGRPTVKNAGTPSGRRRFPSASQWPSGRCGAPRRSRCLAICFSPWFLAGGLASAGFPT